MKYSKRKSIRILLTKEKFFLFLLLLVHISCKKESNVSITNYNSKSSVKYAKGFDIILENGIKKLIIKSPYQNSKNTFEYKIQKKKNNTTTNYKTTTIEVPIKNIIVTSTTHIPMIELLDEEKTIIGFPFSKYISSKKTRKRIDSGFIKELGKENALNTEILLDLQPELIVGFSVSGADKSLSVIEKTGIPVIYNGDWLEQTPLGRAEWIKFFGILFNKEKQADSIFNCIERNYNDAKKLVQKNNIQPKVLSGAMMSKDIWNLPAGESFVAQFFKDANFNYYWKKTKGKGSLSLSFESVLDKAQEADLWINPGYFSTKEQILSNNQLYKKFKAFKNDNIYSTSLKKGKTGGIIYYELAATRPDLVLKDLIKIGSPSLLPKYKFTFFEKIE
jgi:iron complex transport system substrate-binding protein